MGVSVGAKGRSVSMALRFDTCELGQILEWPYASIHLAAIISKVTQPRSKTC